MFGNSHALPIKRPGEAAQLVVDFVAATGPPDILMPIDRAPSDRGGAIAARMSL